MTCLSTSAHGQWKTPDLRFSLRGEVKCVRGPSRRGASRAEEKSARNRACKVFHESRVTNHGLFSAGFGCRVGRKAGWRLRDAMGVC